MEKVSAIVAIYNSEKFLKKLIESITAQTWENLEIILVDDGSPDNSGKICDEYKEKDSRIRVIHKENGGACEARNVGLAAATGEYVLIIDGDDWLELDYVEYLMGLVHKTGAKMAMTDHIFTTRDRKQILDDNIEKWTPEEAFCKIIYPEFPIGPWNKIYETKMLRDNKISFSVPWSGEGLYFASMAAQCSNCIAVGHRKIYNYRLNNIGSGLTHYNVVMGINALENINYIKKVRIIKTKRTENAVNWHIWKNNYFVLFLIKATDSKDKNLKLYKECRSYILKNCISVAVLSEIKLRARIKVVLQGIMPIMCIRRELNQQNKALKKDTME